MTSKNGYEMRLDVLKMAMDIIEDERQSKVRSILHSTDQTDWRSPDDVEKAVSQTAYKTEDVLKRAEELYSFVESPRKRG